MQNDAENVDERFQRTIRNPDSHRVGRLKLTHAPQRQIRIRLRRKYLSRSGRPRTGAGVTVFGSYERRQQVIVKFHVSRHKQSQSGGSLLRRHVQYLNRDGVGRDGKETLFFNAEKTGIDPLQTTNDWRHDRHSFRVIISPERGSQIDDMNAYVKEVMANVQHDLGTELQWIGVNHYNTDQPHAHVVIRGKRPDGHDLVIDRKYISQGFRDRASQVATQWIGERTNSQIRKSIEKLIQAERWTRLDSMLLRNVRPTKDRVVVDTRSVAFNRISKILPKDIEARLRFLHQLGLAKPILPENRFTRLLTTPHRWSIDPNLPQHLKDLGERNDVIKKLHRGLAHGATRDTASIQRLNPKHSLSKESLPSKPVVGRVVVFGRTEEIGDEGFVIVRTPRNILFHARVRYSDIEGIQNDSVLQLGRHRRWRREMVRDIAQSIVEGQFSRDTFKTRLEKRIEPWKTRTIESSIEKAERMLDRYAKYPQSGVNISDAGGYSINKPAFESFADNPSLVLDVKVLSEKPLQQQIESKPYTFLDRQLVQIGNRIKEGIPVHILDRHWRDLLAKRVNWLVSQQFATRQDRDDDLAITFTRTARSIQRNAEIDRIRDQLKKQTGKPVMLLGAEQSAMGTYLQLEKVRDGLVAIVASEKTVYITSVSKPPSVAIGQLVDVDVKSNRDSIIRPSDVATRRLIVERTR